MTALKRGDYCCPSTEAEWKSILDLAEALGIRLPVIYNGDWDTCPFIWYSDTALNDEGICQLSKRSGFGSDPMIEVHDFIAGMYAMKEAKEKKPKVEFLGFAPDPPETKSFSDSIKEAIEPLRQELLSANERITKLENDRAAIRYPGSLHDRITNLEDTIQSHKLGLEQHFDRLKVLGGRIKNLEERQPIDMRECENAKRDEDGSPIIDPKTIKDQLARVNRFSSVRRGDDYDMRFDPAASPKNIPFSVALEYAKRGRLIKRTAWTNSVVATDGSPHGSLMLGDILASDWEVIQETKKP